MRRVLLLLVLVVGACAPQQTQPSFFTQPQPQPSDPQEAEADPSEPRAMTCGQVIGCYLDCETEDCVADCEAGVDPDVVAVSRAMTQCSLGHQCEDAACQQTQCGAELAACTGQQPATATATSPPPPSPAAPSPAAPVAASASYRILIGKKFLGSGYGYSPNRQPAWYVLFDNGRFISEIPFTGLYGVDENRLDAYGEYVEKGNTIETAVAGSTSSSAEFRRGTDGMWTNSVGELWMVDALDNAVLDGTYRSQGGQPIAFSRDGRFTSAELLFIDSNVQTGTFKIPAGSGTYRIARNTLMLAFSNGQVIWIAITSVDTARFPTPSAIYLASDLFQRS
jgi:hypothetical protein